MGIESNLADPAGKARRPPAQFRWSVREVMNGVFYRLSVARDSQGPAAEVDGVRVSDALGLGRHPGAHSSRALPAEPGSGGSRGQPKCRRDRQPERERRRKRGARIDPSGYDAGKKVKGKKRHLLVDTLGLMLAIAVHAADLQDRDGAPLVLNRRTRRMFPFLVVIFADGAYGGDKLRRAMAEASWRIEVVKRSPEAKGFESSPSAGSWNAPSPGSTAADGSPRTTRTSIAPLSPSSAWPASASCSEDWHVFVILHKTFRTEPSK